MFGPQPCGPNTVGSDSMAFWKTVSTITLAALIVAATIVWLVEPVPADVAPGAPANSGEIGLRAAATFEDIADGTERAKALFTEMGKVLTHPRCMNCHPAGDRPLQNDDSQPHQPPVVRGADGFGAIGMRCTACHGANNFAFGDDRGSLPGHDPWHLAPASMAWEGKSLSEICTQIKDPDRNGGKSLADLVDHNAKDGLVGWGWNPGPGRTPAPGSQDEFGDLTKAWVEAGAHCP